MTLTGSTNIKKYVGHGVPYGDVTYSQFKLCVSAQESPNVVPWSMTEPQIK